MCRTIFVGSQTNNLLIALGFVVLAIVVIYVVIIRNPKAYGLLGGLGTARTGAAVTVANINQTTGKSCPNFFVTFNQSVVLILKMYFHREAIMMPEI